MAGLTSLKKETCLGSWSACGVDPAVAFHLRNTADYRLFFGTTWHQTRAFLIAVNNENLINGLLDNSEKEDMSGQLERLRG